MKHNGIILEKMIRKSGFSVSEIAKRLNVSRRNMYHWFNKPDLSVDLIFTVSEMVEYDISRDLPKEDLKSVKLSSQSHGNNTPQVDPSEVRVWMSKYADLLERYTLILESKQPLESRLPV